jgi:two-component system, OmpR family, phosphate regulon sensor histidine kinase PhoR
VRLALPLAGINRAIFNLKLFITGALLTAALVALVAAMILARRITDPIDKISSASRVIGQGNYLPALEVSGNDELSALALNIKEMGLSLKKKIEQVTWEKSKLETVVSSMSSGIILANCDLSIELINPAAEKLFEISADAATGKPVQLAVRYYTLIENLKAVCADGQARQIEMNLYYPRSAILETDILPVKDADQKVIGVLLLFHELTLLRSIEKMRSDFVANVSHELRTPLTAVRGYTETILHEDLTREQLADFLEVIDRETKRLSNLVDDLLDLAQIENEKGFVKKEPVDLARLMKDALERVEELRRQKNVDIVLTLPEEPVLTVGNPEWLRQALVNILENSIRHGRELGAVTVMLLTEGQEAVVEVKDNGPGIPDDDLPYIFERFYRVDKARSRKAAEPGWVSQLSSTFWRPTVRFIPCKVKKAKAPFSASRCLGWNCNR